ncbi:hypothetical protein N7509_005154 [Penicillium cosmopolitanum]|uniref:Potassium channel domain-containing protein n=1 Tax=Penicillium cosmopolitanum TaxID=1131564 RepID=A0A9W9W1X0_9EURO|nr:uncharacterized protein N7509_005154 [Penicillium cosmopolitanum]KAJ5397041.1 hypothetical protein N7509_005154 [Penicillium cosmopolitanum]
MNDPGLDDAIANEANVLDQSSTGQGAKSISSDEKQGGADADGPHAARWWLASTAYPLAAGTFGPMASAFSVCSLSQPWRMELGGKEIPDPKWVSAINAISLFFALIANLFLSLNMARRIRFEVAQPIMIIGWFISSALLIGILIPVGVLMYRPENDGLIYAQSYFYGAFAAGLYFIISSLLTVTAYGAYTGHYDREFKLTTSQRTLMLQTIIFCIYLLLGAEVYATVEGWRFLDAVYFADYTLLTIGVGNYSPATHVGRGLLFPYAIGGILILGLIVSSIRTLMLERGRQKIAEILTEHTRRLFVKQAASDRHRFRGFIPNLSAANDENTDISERERQKLEFITMRRIRQVSTVQYKWVSLLISLVVWMALWLIGAVVFWRSEDERNWTYFEALYFAYTTLLTIGYGDFYPISSLGKAFFVFWSLLAVPTITILISNIGDTLIGSIRDLTIFFGEITILPGDAPFVDRIRDVVHVSWRERRERWLQEITGEHDNAQEIFSRSGTPNGERETTNTNMPTPPPCAERAGLEAEEHKREESARARGDVAAENLHHYHYLLFREIRTMLDYARSNANKEFDYLEWEYYLSLISGEKHKPAAPVPDTASEKQRDEDQVQKFRGWSWIDKRNPLVGEKSEVQWLLNALTDALERELKTASRAFHRPGGSEVEVEKISSAAGSR